MSLDDVVNLTITTSTIFPTAPGFGTPLLFGYHTRWVDRIRRVSSVKEMTDGGFVPTDQLYKMAQAAFSQNPRPASVMIGKRLTPPTQIVELTPTVTTQGYVYGFSYLSVAGVQTDISYPVPGSATVASVITAIVALLNAIASPGATFTDGTTKFTVTASVAGTFFDLFNLPNPADLKIANVTTDPGIVADLAGVEALDSISWYTLAIDSNSKAEIVAMAAHIEATRKLFIANTIDSAVPLNTASNVLKTLKAAAYARTAVMYVANRLLSNAGIAWIAFNAPVIPGSNQWAFETIAGLTVDVLTSGQDAIVRADNGNTYLILAGLNQTYAGKAVNGSFIDIIIGVDWLFANIQVDLLGALAAAASAGRKIPYTDDGVAIIKSLLLARLNIGVANGFLTNNPAPTVTAPKVATIPAGTRASRILPDVKFQAYLAGAMIGVVISGNVAA